MRREDDIAQAEQRVIRRGRLTLEDIVLAYMERRVSDHSARPQLEVV